MNNSIQSTEASIEKPTPAMFELTGIQGRITLDNVYLNGLHALKRLKIRNLSDQSIVIKMRSNLRNQIAFQLENENMSNLPEKEPLLDYTTNTVDWSREAEQYPFNQLFNYINHIDQIDLAPGQSRSFILVFLPETHYPDDTRQNNEDDFDISVTNDAVETFHSFNVTGSLFFFGYYQQNNGINHHQPDNNHLDDSSSKDVLSTSTLADYQLSIKFRASVCQSTFWTDVAETGLNFDDCVLGDTYFKDFTIQNRSEIDLYWLLNTIDLTNSDWIQFVDVETESPLDYHQPVPGFSSKQIRLLFMPKEVGEYNYDLQVENTNDSRNVIQTKVHATVRSVLKKETLIVSSGNVVDFGDCISGSWAVQQIVLNNVSESPVEVRFSPEGEDVIFDIKQDTAEVESNDSNTVISTQTGPSSVVDAIKTNSMRRKYSNNSGVRTTGFNSPTTVISEMSGPLSEFSSRSTSPTINRTLEHSNADSLFSPTTESSTSFRLQSSATVLDDGDSDIGLGITSVDDSLFTDTGSSMGESVITLTSTAIPVLNTTESYTRIEDLVLKPGTERVIQVSYRPRKDISINDFNAGQLIRKNFRITLEYGIFRSEEPKEKKPIQCKARTCTSFVEVIPKVINFGDTDVGTLKSLPINIFNRSDILARVELQFSSKVLNCLRGEITIQPRSYVELKLDLYPRKVNPDYRKQITLVNFLNRDNDQIIDVHSTNIDKNRVTFHSLFYRILTATGANFLDFGSIALNSLSLRTFTVENIRDKPLQLEITTSSPDDIVIYTRNKNKWNESPGSNSTASHTVTTDLSIATPSSPSALKNSHSSTTTKSLSKLSNSITADNLENEDSSTKNTNNRNRSKLMLESISNRRIGKPAFSNATKGCSLEDEAINSRRISDAKKYIMAAKKSHSFQQQKVDHGSAYLDLALSPLHALKSHKRKRIPVHADRSFFIHKVKMNHHSIKEKNTIGSPAYDLKNDTHTLSKKPTNIKSLRRSKSNALKSVSINGVHQSPTSSSTSISKKKADSDGLNKPSKHISRSKAKRSMGITAARYKSRKNLDWSDIAGKSRVPFEDLISVLEYGSKAATPLFPKQSAEEQFVRHQIAWRRKLDRLIEKGMLVRTSIIEVDPKGEEEVVIVNRPSSATNAHVQSAPKKQDARIFLRLLQFDRDIEQTEFESLLDLNDEDIPVREVILRSQLCRSIMDLGQKNINFGLVDRNERHTKTIILHNRSETPLLYAIRKSGSIASGDIDVDVGRYGVVRAYGKREVEFIFEPTLSGPFMEKLIIENIRDRTNDQVLLLKAQVRKPSTFLIKSLELTFGCCLIDQCCQKIESIVLTNTNKQPRMFEIRVDPNEMATERYYVEFDFDVKDDDTNTISKEAEEEIENLEQKLKIAKRKAQPDKIKKYLRKLAKLKNLESDDKGDTEVTTDQAGESKESSSTKSKETASQTSSTSPTSTATSSTILNTTNKENSVIFKKTAESVVFTLEAHATKTITVTFKPISKPFQSEDTDQEIDNSQPIFVKGRILVHEYKNTDICKSVTYTADVYTAESFYTNALMMEKEGESTTNALENAESSNMCSSINLAPSTNITSIDSNIGSMASNTIISNNSIVSNTVDEEQIDFVQEAIQLERNYFDGGRVELNQKVTYYVKLTNISEEPVEFDFINIESPSAFDFNTDDMIRQLLPGETQKIPYSIQPTTVGKQRHTINLINKRTGSIQPYTIQLLVHYNTYLGFPSLADEINGVLDLGYSYVDPGSKYSQVTPLLVENTSDKDILITCQSNLSHQVLIFKDEAGKRGLVEMMPLKGGSMTTVWVAVQPNLLTGYLGNLTDGFRELVGGIKFSIFEKDEASISNDIDIENEEMLLMLTQTVKFTSIIGQSNLEVSDRVINLGYTNLLQKEFYGAFTIKNKSSKLPLDYEVECASGNIELDRRGGTLHGWHGCKLKERMGLGYLDSENDDRRSSSVISLNSVDSLYLSKGSRRESYEDLTSIIPTYVTQITFRINAYRYGLLNEKIIVTNKRNSQEVFVINVRLFVDCKKLDAWCLPSKKILRSAIPEQNYSYDDNDQSHHREAEPLPMIKWDSLYISPVPQNSDDKGLFKLMELSENDVTRLCVREIDIANTSGQSMHLVVMSDVDIAAKFVIDADKLTTANVEDKAELFIQRSEQVLLQPGQRIRVQIKSPSALKLDEEGRELALHGRSGALKGIMVLHDARQDLEVLAMELEALFCVSNIELNTNRIDLGKIGHSISHKPVRFEFQIDNMADVPATYEIHAPSFIDFTPLDRNGVAVKQKLFYIPSRKSQRVEGLLMSKGMPDQTSGVQQFDIRIDNLRNHSNTMHLHLKALMTAFELRFERLSTSGELILPILHYPITLQNATCDNWFIIQNKTYDDLRFEIGADVLPELSPYINLDVLSRYTNSPLKGNNAIGPQGSIEVRVRVSPNENLRLPRDRPEFMDPSGIIMANLWITTRPVEEEECESTTRMKETIPVRCILKETPTFSLSDRRLDFRVLTYYNEDADGNVNVTDCTCMPENTPFSIINHAVKMPLRFKVTVEGPAEFPANEIVMISGLNEDRTGLIEAGGTLNLSVAIPNPKESMPGQLKIHIDDLDAFGEARQTVSMYVTEIVSDL